MNTKYKFKDYYLLLFTAAVFVVLKIMKLIFKLEMSHMMLVMFGALCIVSLYVLIWRVLKICDLGDRFFANSQQNYITVIFLLISLIIYIYINYATDTVKVWDYACYYKMALYMEDVFSNGFINGIKSVIQSIQYSEYNQFLLLFILFPFELTNKSFEAYCNSYILIYVLPTCFIFMSLGRKIILSINEEKNTVLYAAICAVVTFFPLLHAAASKGMPDIGGLLYFGLMILLVYDYDFDTIEKERLILLGIASIALFLFRRWYTFLIVGFYCSYFLYCIIRAYLIRNQKMVFLNIMIYSLIMITVVVGLFGPMIKRILQSNIQNAYAAWNYGGMRYEIVNQTVNLGVFSMIMVLGGWVFGCWEQRIRKQSIIVIFSSLIAMLLFNRIQSMGIHQSLLLVPAYLWGLSIFLCVLFRFRNVIVGSAILILCVNMAGSLSESKWIYNNWGFGKISLKPEVRYDQKILDAVNDFILSHCTSDQKIYMILGSAKYNPEVFKNRTLPNFDMSNLIMDEHSVDLTHGFPEEFFQAKYILRADPVQQGGYSEPQLVIDELDKVFINNSSVGKKFCLVDKIGDENITFYIYERIQEVDIEELEYFESVFSKYYDCYPELYKNRIEKYKK